MALGQNLKHRESGTRTYMEVKELFKKMATRAGIAETDAKLIAALDALPDLEVDDEAIANPLTQNLITEAEATNNPKIKNKFTAEVYNGIDALLDDKLGDFLTPEQIDALKKDQKPTIKKITSLLAKAKELKQSGASASETADTIRTLNEQITKLKVDGQTEVGNLKAQHERERYFDRLAAKVISRQDVTDYGKAKEGKRVISDLHDTLDAIGGVLDIRTGKVMKKDDQTLELYIDNKPQTVDTVLQRTLDDNQYIRKSDPAPQSVIETSGGNAQEQKGVDPSVQKNLERAKAK